jgi:flagellar hook-length control protein FliK
VNAVDFSSGFTIEAGAGALADTTGASPSAGAVASGLFASLVARAVEDAPEADTGGSRAAADETGAVDLSGWLALFATTLAGSPAPSDLPPPSADNESGEEPAADSIEAPDAGTNGSPAAIALVASALPQASFSGLPGAEGDVAAPNAREALEGVEALTVSGASAPASNGIAGASRPALSRESRAVAVVDGASDTTVAAAAPAGVETVTAPPAATPQSGAPLTAGGRSANQAAASSVEAPARREGDEAGLQRREAQDGAALALAAAASEAAGDQAARTEAGARAPVAQPADGLTGRATPAGAAVKPSRPATAQIDAPADPAPVLSTESAAPATGKPATDAARSQDVEAAGTSGAASRESATPSVTVAALPARPIEIAAHVARSGDVALAYQPLAAADRENVDAIVRTMHVQWHGLSGSEARLQLRPEHLGQLALTVRVEHGEVRAHVQAETVEAGQWIEGHQDELRASLREQGLEIKEFVVTTDPDRRREGSSSEPRPPRGRSRRARSSPDDGPRFEVVV